MTSNENAGIPAPLTFRMDGAALVANYAALAKASGPAATGAAVKADGYGLGAREVVQRLSNAGCRNFFVAHWGEAIAIADLVAADQISVLNGFGPNSPAVLIENGALPVLNTPGQIAAWKAAGGKKCHVMFDSGINRLGIGLEQLNSELWDGLEIDMLFSHLACADENSPQNGSQLTMLRSVVPMIPHKRLSFANSAGIMLGREYHCDVTRPGLSLYGGIARPEMAKMIRPVVSIEAEILQLREMRAGQPIGYNATYICPEGMKVATISLGYADGYRRAFSNIGMANCRGAALPVIGRVSMDLVTLDVRETNGISEGDTVVVDLDLLRASESSGISQYELLTGLGSRANRYWF